MTEPDPVPPQGIVAGEPEAVEADGHVPPELGCARCGDCCETIRISLNDAGFTAVVSTSGGMSTMRPQGPHPNGGQKRLAASAGRYARDAAFIRRWMEPTGEVTPASKFTDDGGEERIYFPRQIWRCLKFDPVERTCTAHDERPRMCSEYPWYDEGPGPGRVNRDELRCSYLLDLPPSQRPEGARPLIPLTVL